ncbi:MAG: cell division protein FtsK, partial [Deltaproteobacteria bacterium]|nr:cell division protein FtsK [Deltaproteobacteria bacterium]
RPSKEVITGLIKANFTSRISFRVSSKVDSRIILDQGGADALLGYGDMLYLKPGSSLLTRIHGPFVSEEEVQRVVDHLKTQGEPDYDMEILQSGMDEEPEDMEDTDPLLGQAIEIIMESRRASISYLQRRLKVGYNRAARIMEQVERRGIVGPPDSRGERQVLG